LEEAEENNMNTDKERLDFWNANSLIEFGYSAKMGGDGAGWYWQLGTNRRSGIKNIRDALDSAMAQLKKPKKVEQIPAMRHNPTPRTDAAVIASGFQAVPFGFQEFARSLEIELKEAEQIDNAANHYLSRAEKSEAEVAALKRPLLRLTNLWHQLFFLLDITEESDNGTEFRPNYISSCRAVDGERIQKILEEAKQLINTNVKN
jgi:hypothetical protein